MEAPRFIKLRISHKLVAGLLIAVLFTLVSASSVTRRLFQDLEYRAQDYLYLYRGPRIVPDLPMMIVLVDEGSMDEYGFRSPTPRKLLADLVGALNAKGARCIGLYFLFNENHRRRPDQDQALETALKNSKIPVVLVEGSIPQFTRHAKTGFYEFRVGGRNIVREMVLEKEGGKLAFVGQLHQQCIGIEPQLPADVNPNGMLMHYYGPPSRLRPPGENGPAPPATFRVHQARTVAGIDPELVKGKIVLIGSGASSLGDQTPVPPFFTTASGFERSFGVELNATVLSMILEERYMRELVGIPLLALYFLFFGAIAFSALLLRTGPATLLFPAFVIGWIVLAGYSFSRMDLILPVALPLTLGVLSFLSCQVLLYATETRYSRFLQTTFSRYISPQVVEEMVENRWGLDLGGEMRELTILFSDLAGFTTLSEKLTPHDLVKQLNVYLTDMTEEVFAEAGSVGDFIGDAIMAYWGAPNPQADQAERGCRAALGMQIALDALNERWKDQNQPTLGMRIGVHTGEVILGNVGSEHRQDFTIIGDAVNLASRLEGVNKVFGSKIIVSSDTLEQTGNKFVTRELGRIVVKGKEHPTQIYELLGIAEEISEGDEVVLGLHKSEAHQRYEEGLALFYQGRFADALSRFEQNGGSSGEKASLFMMEQCRNLIENPPTGPWNGALVLTEK